jgi:hypothetical protein
LGEIEMTEVRLDPQEGFEVSCGCSLLSIEALENGQECEECQHQSDAEIEARIMKYFQ